jgi:hypothetical protein
MTIGGSNNREQGLNNMMDRLDQIAIEQRLNDMRREAENERLARSVAVNENDMLRNARNAVGRSLVALGQQLLNDKQR